MNKEIEKYKKKSNKIIRTFKMLGISIFILGILISIVQYTINRAKEDRSKSANIDTEYAIDLVDNNVIYSDNIDINLNINNFDNNNTYKVQINVNGIEKINKITNTKSNKYNIKFDIDGIKKIDFIIYMNDILKYNTTRTIYYIEPYKTQFLEKMENNGVVMHIRDGTREDYLTSIDLFKKLRRYIYKRRFFIIR